MALIQQIPGAAWDSTAGLPSVEPNNDIPELMLNAGTLALIEPPTWAGATVPLSASAITNGAATQAAALTGSSDVHAKITYGGGTLAKAERTTAGALHYALTATAKPVNTVSCVIDMNPGIQDYILANLSHSWYMSVWGRVTRSGDPGYTEAEITQGPYYLTVIGHAGNKPSTGAQLLGNTTYTVGDATLGQVASLGATGAIDTFSPPAKPVRMGNWGRNSDSLTGLTGSAWSWVLYRSIFEDLTVSGRTWAQARDADQTMFTNAFGPGGKYAADTYTAPAALLGE